MIVYMKWNCIKTSF